MPAIPPHKTPTSDASWDGPANEKKLRSGEKRAYYARAYAWADPDGDETVKSSYRFIHHEVDGDGEPGPANVQACITGIAVLNGARGGTTIPESDKLGVYRHLAAHLRDAGREPPDLKQDSAMEMEIRSFQFETVDVDEKGTFTGYASTFGNVDSYGDVIERGAFRKTLADQPERPLLWCHDPKEPIGKVVLGEDERGLLARGALLMSLQRGREVYEMLKTGIVKGLSIGFFVRDSEGAPGSRKIRDIELVEVSVTPFPANPLATIDAVRAARGSESGLGSVGSAPAIMAGKKATKEAMEMQEQIAAIEQRIQQTTGQIQSEIRELGSAQDETVRRLTELAQQLAEMRRQVDLIDGRTQSFSGSQRQSGINLRENESIQRLMRDRRGVATVQVKAEDLFETRTTITSSSISVAPQRLPGVVPEPRRELRVRQLLATLPTNSNAIEFVRILSHSKIVSPQVEGQSKAENQITFQTVSQPVSTIATWIPATKQILEDFDGLEAVIRTALLYALEEQFENQLLLGSGVSPNLNGLVTQATAFNSSLLGTSWNQADVIGRAIQQIAAANEVPPTFVVLNTADAWTIRLMKDNYGQYIFGNPAQGGPTSLFGLDMVVTNAMTSGQFLVGTAAPNAAHIRMRSDAQVEISTEHSDYFTRNMIAIRAELRAALIVLRPGAYVKGSVTRSPA